MLRGESEALWWLILGVNLTGPSRGQTAVKTSFGICVPGGNGRGEHLNQ
jgi:hypothetical protein